jgi:tetraacyldisaccharide 4'-kinase
VRRKIEALIRDEAESRVLGTLLRGASLAYGAAAWLKPFLYKKGIQRSRELPCAVISVGNLTVGGTGKTPMILYLARLVRAWGYRVGVISRGYRGRMERIGGTVSDGKGILASPQAAGDEPFMLAEALEGIPVLVGADRYRAGLRAMETFSPQVLLLDDGFQHIRLARDLDILLVDHHRPFGNGHLLPRGPLREPISAMCRAHVIIETRCPAGEGPGTELTAAMKRYTPGRPAFQTRPSAFIHRVIPGDTSPFMEGGASLAGLSGKRVFAFSGIADNRGFHRSLSRLGCRLVGSARFPDHHWFRKSELTAAKRAALDAGAQLLVTTQKDAGRIPLPNRWPCDLVVLGIEPDFGRQDRNFQDLLVAKLLELTRLPS